MVLVARGGAVLRSQASDYEWRRIEEILRRSESLAAAGQFAAEVMHDLKNPLEAASNLAYLIREEAENPSQVRAYVALLEEQLEQLNQITQQTLSFYKTSNASKPVDLVRVTNAALRVHDHKIAAKDLTLKTHFCDGAVVRGSPGEILQVLTNLMANALDALPSRGTLTLRVRKCEREAHITIADNGHGIPEETMEHIFEPFFTTKPDDGTGLGLAISKSIIESHKGRIRTRSCVRPGRSGTAFRVTLPLSADEAVNEGSSEVALGHRFGAVPKGK